MADKPGVRVDACLPLRLKGVRPEAVPRRQAAVLNGPQVRGPISPSAGLRYERNDVLTQLVARIDALESKIDALVGLLVRKQQQEAKEHAVFLELHRQGLRFWWPEPLAAGKVLELDLALTIFPPVEISFLAEVTSCEPEAPPPEAGTEPQFVVEARFTAISEDSRDEIHRFMLNSQRLQRRTGTLQSCGG